MLALAANGGNVAHTAKQLDIPEPTLRQWAKGKRHPELVQVNDEKKLPLADRLEALAHNLVGDLDATEGRATASYRDKSRTLGIAIDKMQLLRGRPTSITSLELSSLSDDDLDGEIQRLAGRAGAAVPAAAGEGEAQGNGQPR